MGRAQGTRRAIHQTLLVAAALLVLAGTALAAPDPNDTDVIGRWSAVLERDRSNFRRLCRKARGTIDEPGPSSLRCLKPQHLQPLFIVAHFADGRAKQWSATWAASKKKATELVGDFRERVGPEDSRKTVDDCANWKWAKSRLALYYIVTECRSKKRTLLTVGFQ